MYHLKLIQHIYKIYLNKESSQVQVQHNFQPVFSQTFQLNFVQASTQSQNPAQTSNMPPYQPTYVELVNAATTSPAQILLSETEPAFDSHIPGSAEGARDEISTWANFNTGNSLHSLPAQCRQH